ncbi:MAG: response regulator [Ardenticatenales bacterium]|nr:response regulator [Ardenticatenales bacterium]
MDDTPDARELVVRILSFDYEVLVAADPLKGIELAVKTRPDLILLDINMPHMSGREVATRLKSLLPRTPLVAFSADATPGARERALAAGCVGYITKPLDIDTFSDQISAFLNGKREALSNAAEVGKAYQAELVARLEEKVRELSKVAQDNALLNEQNKRLVSVLQRRQRLLEAAARVGQSITSILDLDELLRATVNIICEEYSFYYAAIFLLDPSGEWAVLRAGRGEAGRAMIEAGHKLAVGGNSMIGTAIGERRARIALDVGEEKVHFKNPHLPRTRSEMAMPLLVKDTVLGALSVQSEQINAFSDDDITALQALADQVAIAFNNAQLLRDLGAANRELLRTKTFEAIATATGEAIHWVGNKAAPIPSAARRVREDLTQLLAVSRVLLEEPPDTRQQHPLWPVLENSFGTAADQEIDLEAIAAELATYDTRQLQFLGGLESILEDLQIIEESATTILNIKEDLIGPARLQHITLISLPRLLRQTVQGMGLPAGVVQFQVDPELPSIRGDERQLGQVFNNLVKNAWEALQGHPQPRIAVRGQISNDEPNSVLIQVEDNGPGIPPELLDKIWVSFYTTKGGRGGTGLGLSACMEIVNQSEGIVSVESQVGKGTTFSVTLPIASG